MPAKRYASQALTKIDWTNPHTYIYLDVKEENGNVVKWGWRRVRRELSPPWQSAAI
jgi:hypothetical protein